MKILKYSPIPLLLIAGNAFAGQCEENFVKSGNAFTGNDFKTSVSLSDISTLDAYSQLKAVSIKDNMNIIVDEPKEGSLMVEDPSGGVKRAIPITYDISNEGSVVRIGMTIKTAAGVLSKADDMKGFMCSTLANVKTGKAGKMAAKSAGSVGAVNSAMKVDAEMFSRTVSQEAQENESIIEQRYKNKVLTLTGRMDYVIKDGDQYRVAFITPDASKETFKLSNAPYTYVGISCYAAKGQNAKALSLRKKDRIVMTGTFFKYDQFRDHFWLQNCKFEN